MLCRVTAITADGRRSTLEIEARSLNYAAIEYNHRVVGSSKRVVVPNRETLFEIEADGTIHRTTWDQVLKWGASTVTKKREVTVV
jgi:hypothetical protein